MSTLTNSRQAGKRSGADIMVGRFYREGRRRYRLTAADALTYARDRLTMWTADYGWGAEPDDVWGDDERSVIVYVYDLETEQVVGSLGGVGIEYDVSDHGNTNYDETAPYFVAIVAELVREPAAEADDED